MLVRDLRAQCALRVRDRGYAEISREEWMMLISSAGQDARSSGWLVQLEDDETLEIAANTWEYAVPDDFAYIYKIFQEDTANGTSVYDYEIDRGYWEIPINGGTPVIKFATRAPIITGRNLKIMGQGRPTIYTDENQTIDRGMESFIRERTLYFAFQILGAGLSELARWRQQMSTQTWQTSEIFLRNHPQEFLVMPSSIVVPGRA